MPQFGGASEKCSVCSKTVYLTEKIVVEDKEDKKTFHKTCLKCSHCKITLSLGNYASMQGVFYCKPHFKQLFATKGNYDEGFGKDKHTKNWTPQAVSAPSSFVPVDKEDSKSSSPVTPSSIANKFGKTTLNTEKCTACNKTVYATEKAVIEEKEGKKVFHKTCLKCQHCNVIVSLGNYAAMNGQIFCKPHFKQLFATKGNYEEGFGKEKASSKWEPQAVVTPTSFVPVDKDDAKSAKSSTPDSVASKFNKGTSSEKCSACGKTVYLTEKIVVEDKEDKQTFHKSCLRCKHCQVVLSLGNYASMQGVFYCKPHFKQLFAAKGNYDEGFGKEKHTKKWAGKESGELEPEEAHTTETTDTRNGDREREERETREKEAKSERERGEREREEAEERERVEKRRVTREREEAEEREREAREEAEALEREREREEREEAEAREREERLREDAEELARAEEEERAREKEEEERRAHEEEEVRQREVEAQAEHEEPHHDQEEGEGHVHHHEEENAEEHRENAEEQRENGEEHVENREEHVENREEHVENREEHVENGEEHVENVEEHTENGEEHQVHAEASGEGEEHRDEEIHGEVHQEESVEGREEVA